MSRRMIDHEMTLVAKNGINYCIKRTLDILSEHTRERLRLEEEGESRLRDKGMKAEAERYKTASGDERVELLVGLPRYQENAILRYALSDYIVKLVNYRKRHPEAVTAEYAMLANEIFKIMLYCLGDWRCETKPDGFHYDTFHVQVGAYIDESMSANERVEFIKSSIGEDRYFYPAWQWKFLPKVARETVEELHRHGMTSILEWCAISRQLKELYDAWQTNRKNEKINALMGQ